MRGCLYIVPIGRGVSTVASAATIWHRWQDGRARTKRTTKRRVACTPQHRLRVLRGLSSTPASPRRRVTGRPRSGRFRAAHTPSAMRRGRLGLLLLCALLLAARCAAHACRHPAPPSASGRGRVRCVAHLGGGRRSLRHREGSCVKGAVCARSRPPARALPLVALHRPPGSPCRCLTAALRRAVADQDTDSGGSEGEPAEECFNQDGSPCDVPCTNEDGTPCDGPPPCVNEDGTPCEQQGCVKDDGTPCDDPACVDADGRPCDDQGGSQGCINADGTPCNDQGGSQGCVNADGSPCDGGGGNPCRDDAGNWNCSACYRPDGAPVRLASGRPACPKCFVTADDGSLADLLDKTTGVPVCACSRDPACDACQRLYQARCSSVGGAGASCCCHADDSGAVAPSSTRLAPSPSLRAPLPPLRAPAWTTPRAWRARTGGRAAATPAWRRPTPRPATRTAARWLCWRAVPRCAHGALTAPARRRWTSGRACPPAPASRTPRRPTARRSPAGRACKTRCPRHAPTGTRPLDPWTAAAGCAAAPMQRRQTAGPACQCMSSAPARRCPAKPKPTSAAAAAAAEARDPATSGPSCVSALPLSAVTLRCLLPPPGRAVTLFCPPNRPCAAGSASGAGPAIKRVPKPRPNSSPKPKPSPKPDVRVCTARCPTFTRAPVCGRDGKRYAGSCEAKCAGTTSKCTCGSPSCRTGACGRACKGVLVAPGKQPEPPSCVCDKSWRPVCGANGKVYSNACTAKVGRRPGPRRATACAVCEVAQVPVAAEQPLAHAAANRALRLLPCCTVRRCKGRQDVRLRQVRGCSVQGGVRQGQEAGHAAAAAVQLQHDQQADVCGGRPRVQECVPGQGAPPGAAAGRLCRRLACGLAEDDPAGPAAPSP